MTAISLTEFTAYLRDVVPLVLGGSEGHLATALSNKENNEALQRYESSRGPCLLSLVLQFH